MHCTIDDRPTAPELLGCQERQFGQPAANVSMVPYEVQMTPDDFVARCEPIYREHATAEKEDRAFHRAGQDASIDQWHALDFPELPVLMAREPALLQHLVRSRLGSSLLRSLFPLTAGRTRFVLNSLDTVTVAADGVRLGGRSWAA